MIDNTEELRLLRATVKRQKQELREAYDQVREHEQEIHDLNLKLSTAWDQIHQMRKTLSWRITGPIRVVRMMLR
ncbi:hypothetical protein [Arcanobacterium pinnipediorum]|uniref:Uncharacterized protein n=1 Tax=Arcanobacterium pinnipediorum TaxID=1503041 RepID=A0ABY5AHW7_9ACTO|nr:hypothetical protein [Arcanobacterium pinnipediorum]USR79455.1 hypothetical protein NG665_00200 [Arcanobacterium pinnipediorum]